MVNRVVIAAPASGHGKTTVATGEKAPDAFRTIGELSAELGVAQHILRYWETKFPQLKPLQRAGNRRYYRADDVALARRIAHAELELRRRGERAIGEIAARLGTDAGGELGLEELRGKLHHLVERLALLLACLFLLGNLG